MKTIKYVACLFLIAFLPLGQTFAFGPYPTEPTTNAELTDPTDAPALDDADASGDGLLILSVLIVAYGINTYRKKRLTNNCI